MVKPAEQLPGGIRRRFGVGSPQYDSDNLGFPHIRIETFVTMARWPRHVWTSIFTYAIIFLLFPALCLLAYAWVQQWIF